jgi:hypothetical protein
MSQQLWHHNREPACTKYSIYCPIYCVVIYYVAMVATSQNRACFYKIFGTLPHLPCRNGCDTTTQPACTKYSPHLLCRNGCNTITQSLPVLIYCPIYYVAMVAMPQQRGCLYKIFNMLPHLLCRNACDSWVNFPFLAVCPSSRVICWRGGSGVVPPPPVTSTVSPPAYHLRGRTCCALSLTPTSTLQST